MADRGDTHYHVPSLNAWFLFSSLAIFATTVWMVIDDWNAEWKHFQREFRAIELQKAEEDLAALEAQGAVAREEELVERVEFAEMALDEMSADLKAADEDAYAKKEARYRAEEKFKTAKAISGWDRYTSEEEILHGEKYVEVVRELDGVMLDTRRLELAFEDANAEYEAAKKHAEQIRSQAAEAEKNLASQTADLERVRKRIDSLDPKDLAVKAAYVVRDFPGLDFVGPNLKIDKQVLSNLTFELNFTKKTRIDMCTTCHMASDMAGFEDQDHPYATHPRLDLYLTSKSPHPLKEIGCTICHRGSGEALSFIRSDHRASTPEQADEWYEKYHWKKQHHWDYPMLQKDKIEASCVQCHTTSMELIADDAPEVTEGYRNFERYGCYSCHKVEWFPTKRKRGPSLKNLQAKLTRPFVDAWIARPKSFRPTTWMPQVFHLENYAPDETVVIADYGAGEPILGQAWNDTMVASVSTYLFANHPKRELPAMPVEGDPERGREVFRLTGCLSCHNMEPFPGEELEPRFQNDLAFVADDKNTFGPNLRGVATKIDRTWLYWWLKDPKMYWAETRMPDLRLSEQDAADITSYIMDDPDQVFSDVPDGWEPKISPTDMTALQEQVRWFYEKLGRREIGRRLAGENPEHRWDQEETLKAAVGEALVRNQGCYSCHEVAGLENEMPIGTELTNWGSKTVDKLDFAMAYRSEVGGLPKLDNHYREGWLERKLHRPRSYDLGKIKNPKEKLKMPWFDFTDEEVQSIATFVVGLVDDEVQRARMVPTPEEASMNRGMQVVRQKNCMACHVTEPGTITFQHEVDGDLTDVQVEAEFMPLDEERLPARMQDLDSLLEYFAGWEEDLEEELEEVTFRLLTSHPDVGGPGEKVTLPVDRLVAVSPPKGGDFVHVVNDYYLYGVNVADPEAEEGEDPWYPWSFGFDEDSEENLIEDVDGVARAYGEENYDSIRWTFAPPVLWNEGHKLQREWFYAFLKDPVPLRQQLRVRMPTFDYAPGEAEAVADYFAGDARQRWYARYARALRFSLGRELREPVIDSETWEPHQKDVWPTALLVTETGPGMSVAEVAEGSGLSEAVVRAIENGSMVETRANFAKLYDYGMRMGFAFPGQVSDSYERIERRSPTYRAMREDYIPLGQAIAAKGVNCYSCHPNEGVFPETPIAWAPDLDITKERLREDWVREWLWSPSRVYPGTKMPDNFASDSTQFQELYPGSNNEDQVQAVMDWLFNLDRAPSTTD